METTTALEFNPQSIRLGANYLLLGTDAWLIDRVADQVRLYLRSTHQADLVIVYADEVKAPEFNDVLDTYSIFSSAKLIIIRNAEALNRQDKKKELQILVDYLVSPSDLQSLIIVVDRIESKKSGWNKIRDKCQVVACDPPKYSGMISPWLREQLKAMGKTMTPSAMEAFINRVELNFASSSNELVKLDLLTSGKTRITEEDVLRCIGTSRVGTMIDFYRALGARQAKAALQLLQRMLSSDWEDLQVFFQITRFYNLIYRILLLRKNHISPAEIVRSHLNDLFSSQRQEFMNLSATYRLDELKCIYAILLDTDARIKTSQASGETLLSVCILRILNP